MPDDIIKTQSLASAEPKALPSGLQRKIIYSTGDLKLAMKLILGRQAGAERIRRSFFSAEDGNGAARFVPVNDATIDWAHHVFDRMVYDSSWHIQIS